jgi:hypothetical protein
MFDKMSQAAEKLATALSRRSFVGSLGRWAGATALGLAGVLTTATTAHAAPTAACCHGLRCVRPARHCILMANCLSCSPFANCTYYCTWNCRGTVYTSICFR